MTNLIATLEGLTSPRREVDEAMRIHFKYPPKPWNYTASLDAITALVDRVLPGWQWAAWGGAIEAGSTKPRCMAHVSNGFSQWAADDCPTPAIALCIALIRALEARDDAN